MTTRILYYVNNDRVLDFMRCGWMIDEDMTRSSTYHVYSVIMSWRCSCPVTYPLGTEHRGRNNAS